MFDWDWSKVKENISAMDDIKSIIGVGSGIAILSGLTPRVGLLRSLTIGLRSYFKKTYPISVRTAEIKGLLDSVNSLSKGRYIVVTGGKGYGKSCLIDTSLNRHVGVIKISVSLVSSFSSSKLNFF
jgi:hypothetical protein